MTSPFDYINSISQSKKDMMEDEAGEKAYNAWLINRGLSYFPDTILYANEVNLLHHMDNKLQYAYLINTIRPKKRFSKWVKKKEDGDLEAIMKCYGYNIDKAKSALSILSPDQVKTIKEKLDEGGL
jgi:Bacteriophage clamp loader A subunit